MAHTHEHPPETESGAGIGLGMVLGIILAIVLAVALLWFVLGANLFAGDADGAPAVNPGQNNSPTININPSQPGEGAGNTGTGGSGTGTGGSGPSGTGAGGTGSGGAQIQPGSGG